MCVSLVYELACFYLPILSVFNCKTVKRIDAMIQYGKGYNMDCGDVVMGSILGSVVDFFLL